MDVHFKMEVAVKTGMEGAVMLEYFRYWILKNKVNNKHFYDGKYWTYNSMEAFTTLFPCLSKRQVERVLRNLKNDGYIETSNYNKSAYDRTLWYALTDKAINLLYSQEENPFTQIENSISPNEEIENNETVTPIPIKLPVNDNTVSNNNKKVKNEVVERLWKLYPRKEGKFNTNKVLKIIKEIGEEQFERCIIRYAEECRRENKEKRYILMGNTFIGPQERYKEYMDENYNNDNNQSNNDSWNSLDF